MHMNHLRLVLAKFPTIEHGIRREDVDRVDRQNFASAQRLISNMVLDCLTKIQRGEGWLHNLFSMFETYVTPLFWALYFSCLDHG